MGRPVSCELPRKMCERHHQPRQMRCTTSADECSNGEAAATKLRRIERCASERRDARDADDSSAEDFADRSEARRDCGVGGGVTFMEGQNFRSTQELSAIAL
mmetsp:Transcript_40694/g.95029  ORF Transcript_40694/g.95029 Transcript_40694/m.95029 type:complete len:102 (-) Transcript_40694:139-444(-)